MCVTNRNRLSNAVMAMWLSMLKECFLVHRQY
uniref:Uncharacterized protein n=2 Tax=Anguilla anguilla TaxID=7936 RepID=A0A0E9TCF9_ANGAN